MAIRNEPLILCKPDAVSRGLVGEIVGRIERRGYIVTAMKLMQTPRRQSPRALRRT